MTILKTITLKHIVGGVVLLVFAVSHIMLLFFPIPKENENPFVHSLGLLDTAVALLVGYYFGSSSGSKQKSVALEDALKTSQEQNK